MKTATPAASPDYATAFPNSTKTYEESTVAIASSDDGHNPSLVTLRVPFREVALSGGEPPIRLYDTSGPQGHDARLGLPKLRESWVAPRLGQPCVTQLHYARRGEITPEKLIAIGDVARRFDLYCKITGGQRIDLLGARVDQLPDIWEALVAAGFESGHAYGKAMRTVKSCIGSDIPAISIPPPPSWL